MNALSHSSHANQFSRLLLVSLGDTPQSLGSIVAREHTPKTEVYLLLMAA